jgi:enoyl-CoA hydratase
MSEPSPQHHDAPSTTPILSIADGRATIRLARPREHNRLEPIDLVTLQKHFATIEADPSVRVLVVTGTGKSFSSGFHIGALADSQGDGREHDKAPPKPAAAADTDYDPDAFERTVDRLEGLRIPTIAALNGGVYGGSTDLVLACDFRVGVEGMRLFMPAARLGIVYYRSGLRRYVTRLGLDHAKRLFLTAETIGADELLRIGYLTDLVAPVDLASRVDRLAESVLANAPMAVTALKRALNEVAAGTLDFEALEAARSACARSEDHKEALAAWAGKRRAVFKGR